jgi:hypothetical protein
MPADEEDDLPSTLQRSDDKAKRTFAKTLNSAEETYGPGERARRTAFASLKHTHEKVGDHWEPKDHKGPSDKQAKQGTPESRDSRPTAGGVDVEGSTKQELYERAKDLGVSGVSKMNKDELGQAINKANQRETAKSRERDKRRGSAEGD